MRPFRLRRISQGIALVTWACLASPAWAARLHETAPPGSSIATRPVSRMAEPWWRERFMQKQAELHNRPVDLLWLGDSITQNWERSSPDQWRNYAPVWQRFYGDRHAVDLGFKGDSTCHLLWRLQHGELDDIAPRAAILLIGANNFGHIHTDADATYNGIVAVLDEVHQRLPHTRILVIGVLPSIRSAWVTSNTRALDARLRQSITAGRPYVSYADVSDLFITHGAVDPTKFIDPRLNPPDPPLHPTAQSQERIAQWIEPAVSAMMGDKPHR